MQKKTLLSACIALALSGQGWAADIIDADNASAERKNAKVVCPGDTQKLNQLERKNLPAECPGESQNNLYPWLAVGGTALLTTFAAIELTDNDGHHSHTTQPPAPPINPDDNVIPPDDGGDDDVTPPDDGGDDDVTPPDDGGDDDVTPPDDGGDDDVTPPDDGGDDDVTPPDDKPDPIKYNNNVTWDQAEKTVQIRNATFTYTENADGSFTLTSKDGHSTIVKQWQVDEASNTVVFGGNNTSGDITWRYDDEGKIHITKEAGVVVDGTTGDEIKVSDATITDHGGNTALNGGTVMTVEGDNVVLNNDGKTTAIGEGSVVGILTGDDITINNNGETEVDGGTAVIVNGNSATITTEGDGTFINGGTGSLINGDDAVIDNKGNMTVDGENSVATKIIGDDALIKQEGDLYVSGGAHGIDVAGNSTIVSNKGNITVVDDKSIGVLLDGNDATFMNIGDITVGEAGHEGNPFGVLIDGNHATFVNVGDITTHNSGTGVKVAGDQGSISLSGKMSVNDATTGLDVSGSGNNISLTTYELSINGANATGVNISGNSNALEMSGDMTIQGERAVGTRVTGDDASVLQKGDLFVSGAAHGIDVNGDRAKIGNTGKITVIDKDSIGILIIGNDTQFSNVGEIDIAKSGTGVSVVGDRAQIDLLGDLNVSREKDESGQFQGATGINITGNDGAVTLDGNINLTSNTGDELTNTSSSILGANISGDNNTVDINGSINVSLEGSSNFSRNGGMAVGAFSEIDGLIISGAGNTINLQGGINVSGVSGEETVTGIDVSGSNNVNVSGHSTVDASTLRGQVSLVSAYDGATVTLNTDSVIDVSGVLLNTNYYYTSAILLAKDAGTQINNYGAINATTSQELIKAQNGAAVTNFGTITALPGEDEDSDSKVGLVRASGKGSSVTNAAGGTITLVSATTPMSSDGEGDYAIPWHNRVYFALMADNYGVASNEAGATVNLQGAGTYGVAVTKGTASNAGEINVDGFIPTLDENGTIIDKTFWQADQIFLMAGGMLVGSTNSPRQTWGDGTGLNTGTINVNNEGFGMLAAKGGTVTNQGTINLTSDEGITEKHNNQLFGMGAIEGGVAINDTTGVINIDTALGQAFYNDGTGTVINYGTICTFKVCQNPSEYNPSDNFVTLIYTGGDVITAEGETLTLDKKAQIIDSAPGVVTNAGKVSGQSITIDGGELDNKAAGEISSAITLTDGILDNKGVITSKITQNGGVVNNSGTVGGHFVVNGGTFNNQSGATVQRAAQINNGAVVNNNGTWMLGYQGESGGSGNLDINGSSVFNNTGELILDNSRNGINVRGASTVYNTGHIAMTNAGYNGGFSIRDGSTTHIINGGKIDASTKPLAVSYNDAGSADAIFWNQEEGVINFNSANNSALKFTHKNYVVINDGKMNISGNNAVAMEGGQNAQLINDGTINLGTEGTTETGMIAMQLDASATADAVIENNGTINIYANNSFAFNVLGTEGHVVNNGTVVIADGVTGSGLIKQGDTVNVEGVNGNNGNSTEVHYGDYARPDVPVTTSGQMMETGSSSDGSMNNLNGYVVGTNADGSAGKLQVNNASMSGVEINTGFTAGTSETTVTFDNVVQGSNLTDADAIASTSVVWNAQGSTDASGNVDVKMTKNAYTDVVTDGSVNDVAKALDAGYTNNDLYTSLNVGTTAELNSALKQISGSQATTVFREARVLSNRFSMLADAAPKMGNGLAFNVVAKGDPRAELGNNTEYDMLALRKTLDLSESQSLSMEYGIARLDGDGAQKAGDNGVTGGYSQFFGLKHQMSFDNGMSWNNALRYDIHQLDSSRTVAYGDISKTADTNVKQQYLEFRSEGAKTFEPREGLKITPYAGMKLRHTLEGGYQERNAGDFNLNMNSGSETAVDSIVGLKLDYTGKDGWSANATLEGGPNLSYARSQRTASLAGAGSQHFNVDDGQKGGGINSLASVGVKYSSKESSLNLDAYHWKEDGISDKGVMLNVKKTF
ncbi:autotransporter domain-containing protein [Pseudocitrobacter faecalis]|uniref:BigA/YdbA N-terminal beta-barrel domain-containing protein n=2 Tax=Pseudocitrobacter faecalis TaxID=1398493 RepID=UPI003BA11132